MDPTQDPADPTEQPDDQVAGDELGADDGGMVDGQDLQLNQPPEPQPHMMADQPEQDVIAQAEQDGTLAPKLPQRRSQTVSQADKALVAKWWQETNGGQDFQRAVEQWRRDSETLFGKAEDEGDESKVTFPRILRNLDTSVALCVPEDHDIELVPEEQAPNPDLAPGQLGGDPELKQFALTARLLLRQYMREVHAQEVFEAWDRDAESYRWAVIKLSWVDDFWKNALVSRRPVDDQDALARLRYLLLSYQRGDFTKTSDLYAEMQRLAKDHIGQPQVEINAGFAIDIIPFPRFGISSETRTLEQVYHTPFSWEDTVMRRSQVLAQWPLRQDPETGEWTGIHPDDLNGASVFNDSGEEILQEERERQRTGANVTTDSTIRRGPGGTGDPDDMLLVREVRSLRDKRVFIMVKGLEYFAAEFSPEDPPEQWYPWVVLVINRNSNSPYGLSNTEIQAPLEREINQIRQDESAYRKTVYMRGFYDSAIVDEQIVLDSNDAEANTWIPVDTNGGDITKAFFPFPAAMQINPMIFDTGKLERDQDKAAMLPSQIQGQVGGAGGAGPKYSSEVQLAARGANILTRKKQTTVRRGLERAYTIGLDYLVYHVGEEHAKARAGQYAFWPADPARRKHFFQRLTARVKVSLDADLERSQRIDDATKLLEILGEMKVPLDPYGVAKFVSQLYGRENDIQQLVQPDPNAYVQALVAGGPSVIQQLSPEAQQILAQLGELARESLMQQQAQAAAAGGAPPGAGAPPPSQPATSPTPTA
jgi:hypothetical protein